MYYLAKLRPTLDMDYEQIIAWFKPNLLWSLSTIYTGDIEPSAGSFTADNEPGDTSLTEDSEPRTQKEVATELGGSATMNETFATAPVTNLAGVII